MNEALSHFRDVYYDGFPALRRLADDVHDRLSFNRWYAAWLISPPPRIHPITKIRAADFGLSPARRAPIDTEALAERAAIVAESTPQ